MAQQTITHTGTMTGYVSHGPDVRADAGQPHAAGSDSGPMTRVPFAAPAGPIGKPPSAPGEKRPELPELPDEESAPCDSWRYTATVEAPGPAYGGAAWNGGGGELANAISGTVPRAIESGAGKVIAGIAEVI